MAALHLTPAMLIAAYELLRTTPPFRAWKLPHADAVSFHVTRSVALRGTFQNVDPPLITISNINNGTIASLLLTMAHEMIHMHEERTFKTHRTVQHSWRYRRFAKQVCRHHGFDAKAFL